MAASSGAATCILSLACWTALQPSVLSERPAHKAWRSPALTPELAADGMRVKLRKVWVAGAGISAEEGYNRLGSDSSLRTSPLPWYGGGRGKNGSDDPFNLQNGGPEPTSLNPEYSFEGFLKSNDDGQGGKEWKFYPDRFKRDEVSPEEAEKQAIKVATRTLKFDCLGDRHCIPWGSLVPVGHLDFLLDALKTHLRVLYDLPLKGDGDTAETRKGVKRSETWDGPGGWHDDPGSLSASKTSRFWNKLKFFQEVEEKNPLAKGLELNAITKGKGVEEMNTALPGAYVDKVIDMAKGMKKASMQTVTAHTNYGVEPVQDLIDETKKEMAEHTDKVLPVDS